MPIDETIPKTQDDIEKGTSTYRIVTFADILRALKEHPDWLDELRRLILTEDLLELPKKFDELIKRVERIENDVAILKQDVSILKQDVSVLKKDMSYLKGEVGRLKGKEFERTIKEKYYSYFGRLLRRSKRIDLESILPLIEDLLDDGIISDDKYDSILKLDLIVEGEIRAMRKPVVLAIEISYSVFDDDLSRALERADILATILKKEVIPAVVGVEVRDEILAKAENTGILLVKTDF